VSASSALQKMHEWCLDISLKAHVRLSNMRRGTPLVLERIETAAEKRREEIKLKLHPALFKMLESYKESVEALKLLGPNPPRELAEEICERSERQDVEIFVQHSGCVQAPENYFPVQTMFSNAALESVSDAQGVVEWIHWMRHGTTFEDDVKRMQTDYEASLRVQRTFSDFEALRFGRGLKRFKGELDHTCVFKFGIGLGLELLTPAELADLFAEYCPCGSDDHAPDTLSHLRDRFLKRLERARIKRVAAMPTAPGPAR
jgi:hypothetical protein